MKTVTKQSILLAIFLVLLNGLFYPVIISLNVCKVISFTSYFILFIFAIRYIIKCGIQNYYKPILLVITYILLTIFTSYAFHGQGFLQTFRLILPWFGLGFCFYLRKKQINIDVLYRGILFFCGIYFVCYLIAIYFAPIVIFDSSGGLDIGAMNVQRGWYRVRISGGQFNHLMLYWQLDKYTTNKKKKHLFLALYFLTIIILGLSRQHILIATLLTLYILLLKQKWTYRMGTIAIVLLLTIYVIPKMSIYQRMTELTEEQLYEDTSIKNNIRIEAYDYYLFDYNRSFLQNLLGNGLYHADSSWGKQIYRIIDSKRVILSDVGYASLYFKFGFIGLIILSSFVCKLITYKGDKNVILVKYFTISVLLGTIFSNQFEASFISFSILYYIMYQPKYH